MLFPRAVAKSAFDMISFTNVRIRFFTRIMTNLAFAISPIPAYLPQYLSFRQSIKEIHVYPSVNERNFSIKMSDKERSEGFSSLSVFILIMAHMLRIIYYEGIWILKYTNIYSKNRTQKSSPALKTDIISQSIIMLGMQLLLLNKIVKRKRLLKKRQVEDGNGHLNSIDRKRFSLHNIWNWDSFLIYLEFIGIITISTLVCSHLLMKRFQFSGIKVFGQVSVILESFLALPQIIVNYKNKSTTGLSCVMVFGWFVGDALKLGYFYFATEAGNHHDEIGSSSNFLQERHMFMQGSGCALFIDTMVLLQLLWFYPNREVRNAKDLLRRTRFLYNEPNKCYKQNVVAPRCEVTRDLL